MAPTQANALEVRAFGSRRVAAWKRFNQREYCERHSIIAAAAAEVADLAE